MAYIRLQLINGVGLISDNGAHKVANRNNSDKLASVENGKMILAVSEGPVQHTRNRTRRTASLTPYKRRKGIAGVEIFYIWAFPHIEIVIPFNPWPI